MLFAYGKLILLLIEVHNYNYIGSILFGSDLIYN